MREHIVTGRVYDIQGFSVHDGPGIRTTVFLKGCPLKCPWCHSPESQSFGKQVTYMDMRCVGVDQCGRCLSACPTGAIHTGQAEWSELKQESVTKINLCRELCDDCGNCAQVCCANALSLCGVDYTVAQIMERVRKDKPFFVQSKSGGVTISGGEPLSQHQFVKELLLELKKEGIHTALDTSGYASQEIICGLAPYVDIFLYDLKHMDSKCHEEVVGVPNEIILNNARSLAAMGAKFQIRTPLIPGFNATTENITALGAFCKNLGDAVEVIQLLPYHRFGEAKYDRLQRKCPMPDSVIPPSEQEVAQYTGILKKMGLHVTVH